MSNATVAAACAGSEKGAETLSEDIPRSNSTELKPTSSHTLPKQPERSHQKSTPLDTVSVYDDGAAEDYYVCPRPLTNASSRSNAYTPASSVTALKDGRNRSLEETGSALRILLYLILISPIFTTLFAFYTLFITVYQVIIHPLSLLHSPLTFGQRLYGGLRSPLDYQLRRLYVSPVRDNVSDDEKAMPHHSTVSGDTEDPDPEDHQSEAAPSAYRLLCVFLLSPFYALLISGAACTTAVFWSYTAIIGEPNEGGREGDGPAAVLGVRNLWLRWLLWGCRREQRRKDRA